MQHGFLYLVAVLDWYSRYVLSWELSNTLDTAFCLQALEAALSCAQPQIFEDEEKVAELFQSAVPEWRLREQASERTDLTEPTQLVNRTKL